MFSTFKYSGLPKGTAPGAPVSVGVSRSSAGAVTITWGAPASNGNRPITGYGAYITNQNGGFTAASTTTGPSTYSVTFGTDNHGSYNGYVYTINMIGNSTTAGGGAACAYYGYTFSTGNCDGYTKYDLNTNGSCGFYRVDTEYNSTYCGYNPCAGSPGYGTYLTNYCSGTTLVNRYSDGCNGYYDQVSQYNSVSCGYNPCTCSTAITYNQCDGCAGNGGCDRQTCYRDTCCNITCYCYSGDCCGPS